MGAPQVVLPGTLVTLSGLASTADVDAQPLIYQWSQRSGPSVTLSVNGTITAHSPTFTAPASGSVLEFELQVTDRFGRNSANAPRARVAVGQAPTARFVPDGGVVFGGQPIVLTSISTDPGNLAIIGYDWSLTPGSSATLQTDGGNTALFTGDAVAFNELDKLAEVQLRVTNSIGATSAPFVRSFVIRGANPNNWSIDAGNLPVTDVTSGAVVVQLAATVSRDPGLPDAGPSVAWSCTPPQTLIGPTTLTPSFFAPIVKGPSVVVSCTVLGMALPPLNPAMLSAASSVVLRDRIPPAVVRGLEEPARIGPWGYSIHFDEPVNPQSVGVMQCAGTLNNEQSPDKRPEVNGFVPFATRLVEGATCTATDLVVDRAPAPQNLVTVPSKVGALVQSIWEGPFVSTSTFADPRPVVVTMGTYSRLQQAEFGAVGPPAELIATEGSSLVRFSLDLLVRDAGCDPLAGCQVPSSSQDLGLPPGSTPANRRRYWSGGTMVVAMRTDGGAVTYAERSPAGTWSLAAGPPGFPIQSGREMLAVTQDGGQLFLWQRSATTGAYVPVETVVADGVPPLSDITGRPGRILGKTATPPTTLRAWERGTTTWTPVTLTSPPVDAGTFIAAEFTAGFDVYTAGISRPSGQVALYRYGDTTGSNFNGQETVWTTAPAQGFDFVGRGGLLLGVVAESGDVRLMWTQYSSFPTTTNWGGPPRTGNPIMLDVDPSCEAAWPRLAFVEDALVITWQERCAAGPWRVMARIIR